MNRKTAMSILAAFVLGMTACPSDKSGGTLQGDSAGNTTTEPAQSSVMMQKTVPAQKKSEQILKVSAGQGYKTVSNGWFTYSMPEKWSANTNASEDEEYKVYEAKMFPGSKSSKFPSYIYVSYFAEDNEDIATWQEFVRVNSQNILIPDKKSKWENYEPVKEATVAGRKAYIVARNCRHFLHPNSKDDSYVMKKEKMYVFPASKGYYVVRYASDADYFNEHLKAFENIAASFKGKY